MAETIYYHLKPAAEADLVARKRAVLAKRRLMDFMGRPLLTTQQVREKLDELNREFYRAEFLEVADPSRTVRTRCGSCLCEHAMAADVVHYRCPCEPHVERNALNDRAVSDAVASLKPTGGSAAWPESPPRP